VYATIRESLSDHPCYQIYCHKMVEFVSCEAQWYLMAVPNLKTVMVAVHIWQRKAVKRLL
jgi:hypothetical protein